MKLQAAHDIVYAEIGTNRLQAVLTIPLGADGIVIFAHGSGSSRLSPRNQNAAQVLQDAGLATLLFDLLGDVEAEDRRNVFEIPLLVNRLVESIDWVSGNPRTSGMEIGLFGASTGAAAALIAATRKSEKIGAIVTRGGRSDMAETYLPLVSCPTLFVVGSRDESILKINRTAFDTIRCERRLSIISGATHLFTENGALEQVAMLAADWFCHYLRRPLS